MKAFKVVYKHGHFIDLESGNRIIPIQGAEYTISSNDASFQPVDNILESSPPLDSTAKKDWIEIKFRGNQTHKILKAGEHLFFGFGNSKRAKGDENQYYEFECILHEDLYIYSMNNRTGESESDWRLADCKCQLTACTNGGFTLSDKIKAESLNSLFAKTVGFYFNMQRSTTGNTFNAFFIKQSLNAQKLFLSDIRRNYLPNNN